MKKTLLKSIVLAVWLTLPASLFAQGTTAFTYQGRLVDNGAPATGEFEMSFAIHNNPTNPSTLGSPIVLSPVPVTNGLFTVQLDFGSQVFLGSERWLSIGVRPAGAGDPFDDLLPRQRVLPTPYALFAGAVNSSSIIGQIVDSQIETDIGTLRRFTNPANTYAGAFTGDGSGLTNLNVPTVTGPEGPPGPPGATSTDANMLFIGSDSDMNEADSSVALGTDGMPRLTLGENGSVILGDVATSSATIGATVGGGTANAALGPNSTIGGGIANTASGLFSVVAGGNNNFATNREAFVGGGFQNMASGDTAAIAGGGGNIASGTASAIPGGVNNEASGNFTLAAGHSAQAQHDGAMVFADAQGVPFASTGSNQFLIRASGGVGIGSAMPRGLVEFQGGADQVGSNDESSLAFAFRNGGFRHFLRTRHLNGGSIGNAFDFFLNRGHVAEDSTGPGISNVLGMTIDGVGVGVGTTNTISKLVVNGPSVPFKGQLVLVDSENPSTTNLSSVAVTGWGNDVAGGKTGRLWYLGSTSVGNDDVGLLNSKNGSLSLGSSDSFFVHLKDGKMGVGTTDPKGLVEFQGGADEDGDNDENSLSFAHHGGGFRHFIRTRHDSVVGTLGNAFDFFVNSSSTANGSTGPWSGSVLVATIDRFGLGIGTQNPASPLHVIGEARATLFTPTSDRNAKENFEAVDPSDVLEKVLSLSVTKWNYKTIQGARHMGPVAQDFRAAFGLGSDDKGISTVDADGVALAAIQGLNRKLEQKVQRVSELEQKNRELEERLRRIESLLVEQAQSGGDL